LELTEIGTLTGQADVVHTAWENGVIIASGGKLQYYNGHSLDTLTGSPDNSYGAFVKQGRVWTYYADEIHVSRVGDETDWTNDSNDQSSAQWVQIGYKDGGRIVGVCSLSKDVLIFKDNHHAYHLAGDYPDWAVLEIGRSIDCKDFNNCITLAAAAIVLGRTQVQAISTTDQYGDMNAQVVSAKVVGDISHMNKIRMRYLPSLNQVWFIDQTKVFMFMDLNVNGFFRREYNSPAADAAEANGNVYVLKNHGIYVLNSSHCTDENEGLRWRFQGKTLVSDNDYLIKRVRADITPFFRNYAQIQFRVGRVLLNASIPGAFQYIYHDYTTLYKSKRSLKNNPGKSLFTLGDEIYDNPEFIYQNPEYLFHTGMYRSDTRCVDREKAIKVTARGTGGLTVFDAISFEIAEV
jgi:hypothetical protein